MLFVIFLSSFSKSTIDAEHMNILLLAERKVLFFSSWCVFAHMLDFGGRGRGRVGMYWSSCLIRNLHLKGQQFYSERQPLQSILKSIFKLDRLDITALQLKSTKQHTEVKWKFIVKCGIFQKLYNTSIWSCGTAILRLHNIASSQQKKTT